MDILNSWLLIFLTVYESFTQTLVLNHGQCVFGDACKADKECFFVISVWTWVCFLRFTRSTRRKSLKVCSKGCSKKCTLAPAASWKSLFGTSKNGFFKVDSFKTYISQSFVNLQCIATILIHLKNMYKLFKQKLKY